MLLIVGLGNPGDQYASSRHNLGFMTLDYLMEERVGEEINKKGFHGLYTKAMFCGEQVLFLKPQTYMNLSGQSVVEAMHFFKIKAEDIIVIYDDMDLDVGKIRLRPNGSSGGQKGMGNIIDLLKTQNIKRIRIGIGKSPIPVVDYVLGKPTLEEKEEIDKAIVKACDALEEIVRNGFDKAMNKYN